MTQQPTDTAHGSPRDANQPMSPVIVRAGLSPAADGRPDSEPRRQLTGAAALVTLGLMILGVALAGRPNLATPTDLHDFLADNGPRLFVGWAVTTVSGAAWLVFVAGMRTLLPRSLERDLFTYTALAGQVCAWVGAALATAAVPEGARELSLPTFLAIDEAAHLTSATGLGLTGLALICVAASGTAGVAVPRWFVRVTWVAGVLIALGAVIGPVSIPVLALWMLTAGLVLARWRRRSHESD
jgi:hypothetical protein